MTCLKSNRKLKTILSWTIVLTIHLTLVMPFLFNMRTAEAAKLSDGTWTQGGAPGTTTISFTNTGALSIGDEVVLSFPTEATIDASGTNITMTGQTTPTRTNNGTDNTITITLDGAVGATTAITITMTDGLTSYTTTTFAQQSVAINTNDSSDVAIDFGLALITNDNTTTVTATVPLFANMAIDDTTMDLGTLSTASVAGGGGAIDQTYTFNSNNTSGITVTIDADAELDDGSGNDIDPVADGTVTAGSEEYGIEVDNVSGMTIDATYATGDDPVPTSADTIATTAAAVNAGTFDINYKASIAGTTVAGSYDQVVTVTIATNA